MQWKTSIHDSIEAVAFSKKEIGVYFLQPLVIFVLAQVSFALLLFLLFMLKWFQILVGTNTSSL